MNFDAKTFLKNLTSSAGVYQMFDAHGKIIYVGKARNLKKRVTSYFQPDHRLSPKTRSLMQHIHHIEVTPTREYEALLLESNLIKHHRPRYNVLLRDDKSYPYIFLSSEDPFPKLTFYRGRKHLKGKYFGPYPNVYAVRETLNLLQKIFRIRNCKDSFFRSRTRPCLMYQIDRCTAPCVRYINEERYAEDVKSAVLFLEGKSQKIIELLVQRMEQASLQLNFEEAARLRDQIAQLRQIQLKQTVTNVKGNCDVIACAVEQGLHCVTVINIRQGNVINTHTFFPNASYAVTEEELLNEFITQYYTSELTNDWPNKIIISHAIPEENWIAELLSQKAGKKIKFTHKPQKHFADWLNKAIQQTQQSIKTKFANETLVNERLSALQQLLHLTVLPKRIECFDVSHTQGESTQASCVVFDDGQPNKSLYRRFNIQGITPGDDYGALKQALTRRYQKIAESSDGVWPDIILIDGGKGQLHQAEEVMAALGKRDVCLVGIAKGPSRKAGLETLYLSSQGQGIHCDSASSALHLVQQVRDEAHRFAITGHRQQRGKKRKISMLEQIEGVGPKRRRDLLQFFGGLQSLKQASLEDLMKIPGINRAIAQRIIEYCRDLT